MPEYVGPSHWTPELVYQRIDPILLNDRRVRISEEMGEAIRLDRGLARAEEKRLGNAGEWVRLEIKRTDEWAEKLVQAWLEIWEIQCLPRCNALFRAIFDWELTQLFATRNSNFQGASMLLETRSRQAGRFAAARGQFAREIGELRSKWSRNLDVADRKCMYEAIGSHRTQAEATRTAVSPTQVVSAVSAVPIDKRKRRKPSKAELRRMQVIFGALQLGLTGLKYCNGLDRERLPIPQDWRIDGCPENYRSAYTADPKWKKRIQDQKCKYREKYDAMAPNEREQIIQTHKRRTRQTR